MNEVALRYAMQSIATQEPQNTLLFAATGIVLVGTLIVFVAQIVRGRKDRD